MFSHHALAVTTSNIPHKIYIISTHAHDKAEIKGTGWQWRRVILMEFNNDNDDSSYNMSKSIYNEKWCGEIHKAHMLLWIFM